MSRSVMDRIRDLDGQLLMSSARLSRYVASDAEVSAMVQRHVINRQLDARLVLMAERDGAVVQ